MINNHCYYFEYRLYKKGFLDNFVDATYILTLEGSDRIVNIEAQLSEYIPTKNIYIVINKGYKKCDKILYEQIPPYDIKDAYFNTFEHSIKNNFNNILILEDDFIFNPNIKNTKIINEIELVFNQNKNEKMYFNLGPYPFLFYPNLNIYNNIYRGLIIVHAQSIIYNRNIQLDIIKNYKNNYKHWDVFITLYYKNYFYKHPLCYQIFPETNNKQYWMYDNILKTPMTLIMNLLIKKLKLDIQPNPGYKVVYKICFIFNYILFMIIFILLVYYLIKNIKFNKNIKFSKYFIKK